MQEKSILVIGDFMLDTYTTGSVRRVSPEAPVVVLRAEKVEKRPGGAGNVVLNLVSLGAKVIALGRLGDDEAGETLLSSLQKEGVNVSSVYRQKGYITPIKNRILAGNQQIVRVDFEEKGSSDDEMENKVLKDLPDILRKVSVVAVSDYAKGFLSPKLLEALFEEARKREIPVLVDPKGKDFTKYRGAFLIKPNLSEAIEAGGGEEGSSPEALARRIAEKTGIENIMITRSSRGISLFQKGKREDFPVKVREVVDVTGAGDTVLSVLTVALSHGIPLGRATELCNVAAGRGGEDLGCSRISIKELAELVLERHFDKKVFFEPERFSVLQFILERENFILIELLGEISFSPLFFVRLKELKEKHPDCRMLLSVEEGTVSPETIDFMASFREPDFILQKKGYPEKICAKRTPEAIYDYVEGQFTKRDSFRLLFK